MIFSGTANIKFFSIVNDLIGWHDIISTNFTNRKRFNLLPAMLGINSFFTDLIDTQCKQPRIAENDVEASHSSI